MKLNFNKISIEIPKIYLNLKFTYISTNDNLSSLKSMLTIAENIQFLMVKYASTPSEWPEGLFNIFKGMTEKYFKVRMKISHLKNSKTFVKCQKDLKFHDRSIKARIRMRRRELCTAVSVNSFSPLMRNSIRHCCFLRSESKDGWKTYFDTIQIFGLEGKFRGDKKF